ncbi:hypothetical protein, partial [Halalkalibacter wakoensis]|uniref:hypothetical protein n=1 Tax=Halalkalibacter wakoensis TaxID=127891 RepID=UPI000AFAEFBB
FLCLLRGPKYFSHEYRAMIAKLLVFNKGVSYFGSTRTVPMLPKNLINFLDVYLFILKGEIF